MTAHCVVTGDRLVPRSSQIMSKRPGLPKLVASQSLRFDQHQFDGRYWPALASRVIWEMKANTAGLAFGWEGVSIGVKLSRDGRPTRVICDRHVAPLWP